jgi:hypothetical protein
LRTATRSSAFSFVERNQENEGDKMQLLYDHPDRSRGCRNQRQAIREGFTNMKLSIQKERDAMEKLWNVARKTTAKSVTQRGTYTGAR